jgi:hypothetical protein
MIGDPPLSGNTVPNKTLIVESFVTVASFCAGSGYWGTLARTKELKPDVTLPPAVTA